MTSEPAKPKELKEFGYRTDSYDILARARKQANDRSLDDYFIVDVDSHIGDGGAWGEVIKYIENDTVRDAAFQFGQGTGRGAFLNDTPGLQWQSVGGRIPHGQGLHEVI